MGGEILMEAFREDRGGGTTVGLKLVAPDGNVWTIGDHLGPEEAGIAQPELRAWEAVLRSMLGRLRKLQEKDA